MTRPDVARFTSQAALEKFLRDTSGGKKAVDGSYVTFWRIILRYPEIMERSLVYQGRKHYFIIEFAQKPGQLRQFVDDALGPTDDIVRFEYIKKTNKERGAALVGIELKDKADLEPLLRRMEQIPLNFRPLGSEDLLYDYIV